MHTTGKFGDPIARQTSLRHSAEILAIHSPKCPLPHRPGGLGRAILDTSGTVSVPPRIPRLFRTRGRGSIELRSLVLCAAASKTSSVGAAYFFRWNRNVLDLVQL